MINFSVPQETYVTSSELKVTPSHGTLMDSERKVASTRSALMDPELKVTSYWRGQRLHAAEDLRQGLGADSSILASEAA